MESTKRSVIPALALICALAALILSVYGLVSAPEDQSYLIDGLYEENVELREQVGALEDQLEELMTAVNLQSWKLDVAPWDDNTGADVTFTAVPTDYRSDLEATLLVMMDGHQIHSQDCLWDGGSFTATVSVNAADGYSYVCVLTTAGGSQRLNLTGPDSADAGIPVYLESSLGSYCNLVVDSWIENRNKKLTLTDAYAQVQLPRVSAGGTVEIAAAELVLWMNDEEYVRTPIELAPSEVEGSYELTITDLEIPMPHLGDEDLLELYLEVSLSNGHGLNAFGITWHLDKGKLVSAVG